MSGAFGSIQSRSVTPTAFAPGARAARPRCRRRRSSRRRCGSDRRRARGPPAPIAFASASTASVSPPTAAASSSVRPASSRSSPGASAATIRWPSTAAGRRPARRARSPRTARLTAQRVANRPNEPDSHGAARLSCRRAADAHGSSAARPSEEGRSARTPPSYRARVNLASQVGAVQGVGAEPPSPDPGSLSRSVGSTWCAALRTGSGTPAADCSRRHAGCRVAPPDPLDAGEAERARERRGQVELAPGAAAGRGRSPA